MAATVRLVLTFPSSVPNSQVRELVEEWLQQAEELNARSQVQIDQSALVRRTPGLLVDVESNGRGE